MGELNFFLQKLIDGKHFYDKIPAIHIAKLDQFVLNFIFITW